MLSELTRPKPSRLILDWFSAAKLETPFVSVPTFSEIRKSIENLDGGRDAWIAKWLKTELPAWFKDRVLPVDASTAAERGRLAARFRAVPASDDLIAVIASRRSLAIVTCNEAASPQRALTC